MTPPLDAVSALAATFPALRLLVLHGSRARGDAHESSDWDFAFLADPGFDADALLAGLVELLRADHIDLADLDRASALLRHKTAGDGVVVFERSPDQFKPFQIAALTAWSDMEPVLRPEYEDVLARLPR